MGGYDTRGLSRVDQGCGQLSGLIDAESAFEELLLFF